MRYVAAVQTSLNRKAPHQETLLRLATCGAVALPGYRGGFVFGKHHEDWWQRGPGGERGRSGGLTFNGHGTNTQTPVAPCCVTSQRILSLRARASEFAYVGAAFASCCFYEPKYNGQLTTCKKKDKSSLSNGESNVQILANPTADRVILILNILRKKECDISLEFYRCCEEHLWSMVYVRGANSAA